MTDHFDRTDKLTDAEFEALERNADGDVTDDLEVTNIFMTEAQIERLTGDDQSRVEEYKEDMRCMMADLEAEFG